MHIDNQQIIIANNITTKTILNGTMLNLMEELKKLMQKNEFFKYMTFLGGVALGFLACYYGGKEIGKLIAELCQ